MLRLYVMHETYDVVPAYDSTGPFRSMSAGHKEQTCPSGFRAKDRNEQGVIRGLSKVGCDMETTEQVIEFAIVTWSGLDRRLGAFPHPRKLELVRSETASRSRRLAPFLPAPQPGTKSNGLPTSRLHCWQGLHVMPRMIHSSYLMIIPARIVKWNAQRLACLS